MTEKERVAMDQILYEQVCGDHFVANDRYVQMIRHLISRLSEILYDNTKSLLQNSGPKMKFTQERVEMYRARAAQLKQRLLGNQKSSQNTVSQAEEPPQPKFTHHIV